MDNLKQILNRQPKTESNLLPLDRYGGVITKDYLIDNLANMIYGEVGNQPYKVKEQFGSLVFNRLSDKKHSKEFGSTIRDILQKGFYAVKNPNYQYLSAKEGIFPSDVDAKNYLQAQQVASDLINKLIIPMSGQFAYTNKEVQDHPIRTKGLKNSGKTGKYNIYSY